MKLPGCLALLAAVCALTGRSAYAGLVIAGPQSPVQEGEDVVLECLSDEDSDMENYTFEKYSTWMNSWVQLDSARYLRCWFFNVNISRTDGRLLMQLNDISEYQKGPYRCVSKANRTSVSEASENITLSVIYLQDIYFQREHSWRAGVSDILWVKEGSTLEVKCSAYASQEPIYEWSEEFSDWILPSDTLTIKNVNEDHEATYVCQARHPDMPTLVKRKSFQLRLMPKDPELVRAFSSNMSLLGVLLYITIPAVLLTTIVFSVFAIILRHRREQLRKPQISLVDGEKRTPIYKGSLQSLRSNTSDTQPLVM